MWGKERNMKEENEGFIYLRHGSGGSGEVEGVTESGT